jgi:hypothetical protein
MENFHRMTAFSDGGLDLAPAGNAKIRTVWPFGMSAAEFTFKLPTPCFDNEFTGCYSKFCPNGGVQ